MLAKELTIVLDVEKQCSFCQEVKPWSNFNIRKTGRPTGYCRDCEHIYQKIYRYPITVEQYLAMVATQNASYIRGILCGGCNSGLAYFREDATTLTGAIAYLGGVLRT
jgi:hypothetical protein